MVARKQNKRKKSKSVNFPKKGKNKQGSKISFGEDDETKDINVISNRSVVEDWVMNENDLRTYLPTTLLSPEFTILSVNQKRSEPQFIRLPLFESIIKSYNDGRRNETIFVGSALEYLEWLPFSSSKDNVNQYLLASVSKTRFSNSDNSSNFISSTRPGMLVLWRIPDNGLCEIKSTIFRIFCHQFAPVRQFSVLIFQSPSLNQQSPGNFIALCGCDSTIRICGIYLETGAIPLNVTPECSTLEEALLLCPGNCETTELEDVYGIAKFMSWKAITENVCRCVAAYSNGWISVFTLNENSIGKDLKKLTPDISFCINENKILSVSWFDKESNIIIVGFHGDFVRLYDIYSSSVPLIVLDRACAPVSRPTSHNFIMASQSLPSNRARAYLTLFLPFVTDAESYNSLNWYGRLLGSALHYHIDASYCASSRTFVSAISDGSVHMSSFSDKLPPALANDSDNIVYQTIYEPNTSPFDTNGCQLQNSDDIILRQRERNKIIFTDHNVTEIIRDPLTPYKSLIVPGSLRKEKREYSSILPIYPTVTRVHLNMNSQAIGLVASGTIDGFIRIHNLFRKLSFSYLGL